MTEEKKESLTDKVDALLGKTAKEAIGVLSEMKKAKEIASFRLVPMGQAMTMEVIPGRVQLLLDAKETVITVEIS